VSGCWRSSSGWRDRTVVFLRHLGHGVRLDQRVLNMKTVMADISAAHIDGYLLIMTRRTGRQACDLSLRHRHRIVRQEGRRGRMAAWWVAWAGTGNGTYLCTLSLGSHARISLIASPLFDMHSGVYWHLTSFVFSHINFSLLSRITRAPFRVGQRVRR